MRAQEETIKLYEAYGETVFRLPEKYKDLVYLHYYEGYSIEEIAKIMGKKSSTLRSRLSKAKVLLKQYLD